MICEWYARCTRRAVALISHPILGEVPTCQHCIDKHEMGDEIVALIVDHGVDEDDYLVAHAFDV